MNFNRIVVASKVFYRGLRNHAKPQENRNFYTDVQGFHSKLHNLPATSVVQGSKLSSLLYTIFTIDTTRYNEIMKNKALFKEITGRDPLEHEIVSHKIFTYVDDTQHAVSAKTHKDLKNYIHDLHLLLITMYKKEDLSSSDLG